MVLSKLNHLLLSSKSPLEDFQKLREEAKAALFEPTQRAEAGRGLGHNEPENPTGTRGGAGRVAFAVFATGLMKKLDFVQLI